MAYSTRNSITEQKHNNSNPQTATAQFADKRTSTAKQLEQQTLMAESVNAIAQRAAVSTMNISAVQQKQKSNKKGVRSCVLPFKKLR